MGSLKSNNSQTIKVTSSQQNVSADWAEDLALR